MDINIIGCGAMASQIAALFYLKGDTVFIWNHSGVDENKIQKATKLIKRNNKELDNIKEGTICVVSDLSNFRNNLTLECVIEDLNVKKEIYKKVLQKIDKPFFTNSSSISPLEIGNNVNGLHFFNPISQIKLIEFSLNIESTPEIKEMLQNFSDLGFEVVDVKNNRGYIANYIIFSEISSVFKLIEIHGYKPQDLAKIYNTLFNKNLFRMIDLIGVDVTYKILCNLNQKDSGIYIPQLLKLAIDNGILGKKNGTSIMNLLEKKNV